MLLRALFISTLALSVSAGLTACSTVTDKIPTVKIERKNSKQVNNVETPLPVQQASYSQPNVRKAESAMVCENENMRTRATDQNMKNDMARVLILEEGGRSSNIIADVEVNCRDYFQTKNQYGSHPIQTVHTAPTYTTRQTAPMPAYTPQSNRRIITAPAPAQLAAPQNAPKIVKAVSKVQAADGYYYSIKSGDTMYGIARENCSSVTDISNLNGISDPTKIEVHQIIRLPAKKCNARN